MAVARANPQLSAGGARYPATHTLSYAVPSGDDRVLVVRGHFLDNAVGSPGPDFAVTATYNGVALTQAATATGSSVNRRIRVHLWYLINPPVGTANIVVTFPDQGDDFMASSTFYAVTLTGVKQASPVGATATGSGNPANSLALTGCAAESMILAAVISDSAGPPTWTWATATEEYDGNYGNSTILGGHTGAYYDVAEAGNVTLTATRSATATGPGQVGVAVEFLIAPMTEALSGSSAAGSDADGALSLATSLSGTAAATSDADGALSMSLPLSGSAAIESDATGSLGLSISLSGQAAIVSDASGQLDAGHDEPLSGSSAVTSDATANLSLGMSLSGQSAIQSGADGQLDGWVSLAGQASVVSDTGGSLGLSLSLAGFASITSNADGAIDASSEISLTGDAGIVSGADGSMGLSLALAGSASITSGATGVLSSGHAEPLSGEAAIVSSAGGSVSLGLMLNGAAAIASGAGGSLSASGEAGLSGQASITSDAQGSMKLSLGLSGSAHVQSGADGKLVAGVGMSGQAAAVSQAIADLRLHIALSGDAAIISSAVIVTAIIPIVVYVGSVRSPSRRGTATGPRLTGSVRSPGDLETLELL